MKSYDQRSESGRLEQERQPTNSFTLKEAYRVLSSHECDVLELIGEGKSNRQIAASLFISLDTVESHITRIGSKLGLKGWGALRKWAQSNAESLGACHYSKNNSIPFR